VPSSQQRGELAEGGICRWLFLGRFGVAGSNKNRAFVFGRPRAAAQRRAAGPGDE
jgi:hypothetical protein